MHVGRLSVFQSAGGAPALQEDDAPSRAKPESGQPTSPVRGLACYVRRLARSMFNGVDVGVVCWPGGCCQHQGHQRRGGHLNGARSTTCWSVVCSAVLRATVFVVCPANLTQLWTALGANHKHTIHPHTSPTSLQGRLQASALRRSSTTSVTSRSVASSSPPPAHDSAASGGGGAASRAPGVDGAKLGVLSSPDSQHTNDSSLYITTGHEAAGQMSGHHGVGGPDDDDGANAMLLGSIKTPNYSCVVWV